MAGIYIHIPFCKRRCHYCNFFSVASIKHKEAFVEALLDEIEKRRNYLKGEEINTIYFGGGTPSILEVKEIKSILDRIREFHTVNSNAEITLEANPDDLGREKLQEISQTGINRLSIGIQSFFDDDLEYLNRIHSAKEAEQCIELAVQLGFTNLTIDLIYGIPTLTENKWIANLEKFHAFNLPHLSAYSLTVEEKTPLSLLIRKKKLKDVDERSSIGHFTILTGFMADRNYIHYEISNFAKQGYYSIHNSLYWMGGNYLGLGPSAHSFNGVSRQWNISSVTKYIQNSSQREVAYESEILSAAQKYNEYIMTSLRTVWGCDLEHIENVFGKETADYCLGSARKYLAQKKLHKDANKLYLTEAGKLYADGIASDLFL